MRKWVLTILCFATVSLVAVAQQSGLEGTWTAIAAVSDGKKMPEKAIEAFKLTLTMKAGRYDVLIMGKKIEEGTYKVDATKKPAHIDLTITDGMDKGKVQQGLYKIEGDRLTLIFDGGKGSNRPKTFESVAGSNFELTVLTRSKK